MPIRPDERKRYPHGWRAISAEVKARAGGRCEGSPLYPDCRAVDGEPHPVTGSKVVLTVGHLDHTPENVGDAGARPNLRCWCQRCHNGYDAPHRLAGRRARQQVEAAEFQPDLFT